MRTIKFNIEHFKIGKYENGYQYYLHFLIRYFYHGEDFSGRVEKNDFLQKGQSFGFSYEALKGIYYRGKTNNPFFLKVERKEEKEYIYLASLHMKKQGSMLVYINKGLMKQIATLLDFRSFCYIIISANISLVEGRVKKVEYISKLTSRSLNTIAKSFGNSPKSTMSCRLKEAQKRFSHIFNITQRYTTYNGFIAQTTNVYSLKGVRYVYWIQKNSSKKPLSPQFIPQKKVIFGEKIPGKATFLSSEQYRLKNH